MGPLFAKLVAVVKNRKVYIAARPEYRYGLTLNKIYPYLLAFIYSGRMDILPNLHETEQYMNVAYCRKANCEMWSTTMKACSQRGFFDDDESWKEGICPID